MVNASRPCTESRKTMSSGQDRNQMAIASIGVTHELGFRKYHRTTQGVRTLLLIPGRRMQLNRNPGASFRKDLRGTTRKRTLVVQRPNLRRGMGIPFSCGTGVSARHLHRRAFSPAVSVGRASCPSLTGETPVPLRRGPREEDWFPASAGKTHQVVRPYLRHRALRVSPVPCVAT